MPDRSFTDEELVAFLDGEADYAPMAEIERALHHDSALRARLEALSLDRAALAAEFEDLLPDKLLMPVPARVSSSRGRLWAGLSGVAVAASMAIGFLLGSAQTWRLDDWADYVAAYQALYSTSTLAHVSSTPEEKQAQLDRVASAIGKSISVDSLDIFPEVRFSRSQILSFEEQALIQLAFLTSTGEPVALCIIRSGDDTPAAPHLREMEGLSTALWAQNGYDYILIGGQDDALIARMSQAFASMEI